MQYKTRIDLHISPVYYDDPPEYLITFSPDHIYSGLLTEPQVFTYQNKLAADTYEFTVEFLNKKDTDTRDGLDKAIVIDRITVNGLDSPKFVWQGIYIPDYPEGWRQQQLSAGNNLEPELKYATYMGWNGIWRFAYTCPVYTWIHQVEDLGWIYD